MRRKCFLCVFFELADDDETRAENEMARVLRRETTRSVEDVTEETVTRRGDERPE